MAMRRTKQPWMSADEFGRSLRRGVGLNLLTTDVAALERFFSEVLAAQTIYVDEDFAAIDLLGSIVMLHGDHSYEDHEMGGVVRDAEVRGLGVEIRVYGLEPDLAESRARAAGHSVLAGSIDKPHGLRECHIIGPDGYIFVPSHASP